MHKNQFTIFISILLAGLTLAVGGVGIYTYRNLDKVVEQLKHESGPDYNLILLKDIMVSVSGIETDMEAYLLTDDDTYINRYNQRINDVGRYLDSLQHMNAADSDFIRYTDSLKSLINRKVEILTQFQQSVPYNLSGTIHEFSEKLKQIPIETSNPQVPKKEKEPELADQHLPVDTLPVEAEVHEQPEKRGFLKNILSIFSKNKAEEDGTIIEEAEEQVFEEHEADSKPLSDSSFIAQKTIEYRNTLQRELFKLRQKSSRIGQEIRQQELILAQNQQTVQSQIIDLLSYLEDREISKIKIKSYNAQVIADETNDQVFIFSILTTILLVVTIIVIWSYFEKNVAYQKILRKATNDAKKLARAKEQFLANMSHEIRTPMNAISGFTQQLLKTDLSPDQKEQLEIINRSSEHLLYLLNDVLDFSKLQAQKLRLEKTDFDLPLMMTDTIKLMRQKAKEKKLKLTYTSKEVPKIVNGDPYRLRQILINLISNAIKFTQKGEVSISISGSMAGTSKCRINLIVRDTGIGIPRDQHARIMKEFEQAGSASDHKGTGLGLAITRKIVSLHGGKMKLKSNVGEGTEIMVSLPYEIPSVSELPVHPIHHRKQDLSGIRILIADDEPYNLKLLTTILKNEKAEWTECKDGLSALADLQKGSFDIALLDIRMPGLTGYQVAKKLRQSKSENASIPLIALTATVTKEEFDKCLDAGFNKVIRKPFKEEELFEAIVMGTSGEKKAFPLTQNNDSVHSGEHSESYSLDNLHKMGDEYFVTEMVQAFMISSQKSMELIRKNIESKSWESVANEAHKLVSSARHLEATRVVTLLKEIELKSGSGSPALTMDDFEELLYCINELNKELNQHIKTVHT